MFLILAKTPMFDNRDAFCGSSVRQAVPYAYETAALAHRMTPSGYDDEGQSTEETFYVADAADPYRRAIPRPTLADDGSSDIPF